MNRDTIEWITIKATYVATVGTSIYHGEVEIEVEYNKSLETIYRLLDGTVESDLEETHHFPDASSAEIKITIVDYGYGWVEEIV